ncbi:MAG TPA: TonB-dependent receptor [Longimicrobium sp.]|nr:TonB-dependent receptor [Longimicrobium sp.]
MMINGRAATLLLALALAPGASAAQAVQGRLIGRETQAPVRGGTVHLMAADSQVVGEARTDSAGRFTLQAPRPGRYWLLGSAPGYEESETDLFAVEAQGTRVSFVIGRGAVVLDTVTATGTRVGDADRLWYGGFYQRLAENRGGRFITRQQIDRQRYVELVDVLRSVPSLEVTMAASHNWSNPGRLFVRLRHPISIRSHCWTIFYLNGQQVEPESVEGINPAEIEGIEIYTHGAVPAQFNTSTGAACGVVAIWMQAR